MGAIDLSTKHGFVIIVVIVKYSVIDTEEGLSYKCCFFDLIAYISFINSIRNDAVSHKW